MTRPLCNGIDKANCDPQPVAHVVRLTAIRKSFPAERTYFDYQSRLLSTILSLLRRDWAAVRIENGGGGFLLQTVSQFAAGEVFQLLSLAVDSIDSHAAF